MLLIECLKEAKMYLTFHIYKLRKDFTENFEKKFGGYPHFGPHKGVTHKNEDSRTPYDTTFLLQNPVLLSKWGGLQKTRAHSVEI